MARENKKLKIYLLNNISNGILFKQVANKPDNNQNSPSSTQLCFDGGFTGLYAKEMIIILLTSTNNTTQRGTKAPSFQYTTVFQQTVPLLLCRNLQRSFI